LNEWSKTCIRDELLWLRNGYYRLNWFLPYTGPKLNCWAKKTYKRMEENVRARVRSIVGALPVSERSDGKNPDFFLRLHDLFLLPSPSRDLVGRPLPSPSSCCRRAARRSSSTSRRRVTTRWYLTLPSVQHSACLLACLSRVLYCFRTST
jgi:hypothetical protein